MKKLSCPLLAAIFLALSFPNSEISGLAWVALIPIFFILENSSSKKSFVLFYLAGLIFFGITIYWLTHVSRLGYVVLISYLSLYFALFGFFGRIFFVKLRKSKLNFLLFLAVPSLWVSLEFIRGFIFTGFPWSILGYSQYKNPVIIQIADITGPYGVSFVIVLVNFVLYSYLSGLFGKRRMMPAEYGRIGRQWRFQAITAVIILAGVILYGRFRLNESDSETGFRLSVVQGNIEQEKKWDAAYKNYILGTYEILTSEAAYDKGDLIIWPETSIPGFLDEGDIAEWIKKITKDINIPLLAGAVTYESKRDERYFNSAVLFSENGAVETTYHKIHLVPLGEYVPFEQYFPFVRGFISVPIGDYTHGNEFTLFDIESKDGARLNYAALICFEDIFPDLTRRFVHKGARFMVNITNDAWFKESGEQLQHAQASVFRAVENRISVLRAANTGFSCYITPRGIIEGSIYDETTGSMYIPGFKTFTLKTNSGGVFYTKYGDIFAYACLILTVFLLTLPKLGLYYRLNIAQKGGL